MTLNKSSILREFPFSHLVLPADETVILTDDNWTFHRPEMQAVLISNKALYLGWTWQDRVAKWRRFPLTEITCATLIWRDFSVASLAPPVLIGLLFAGLLFFVSFKLKSGWEYAILFLWIIASGIWAIIRGEVYPPCALRIERGKKSYTWRMPVDSYTDDVDYDCWIVQSTLDKLAELGVKTAHRERRVRD